MSEVQPYNDQHPPEAPESTYVRQDLQQLRADMIERLQKSRLVHQKAVDPISELDATSLPGSSEEIQTEA